MGGAKKKEEPAFGEHLSLAGQALARLGQSPMNAMMAQNPVYTVTTTGGPSMSYTASQALSGIQ